MLPLNRAAHRRDVLTPRSRIARHKKFELISQRLEPPTRDTLFELRARAMQVGAKVSAASSSSGVVPAWGAERIIDDHRAGLKPPALSAKWNVGTSAIMDILRWHERAGVVRDAKPGSGPRGGARTSSSPAREGRRT